MGRLVLWLLFVAVLSGCSIQSRIKCRELQASGKVPGTIDSCSQCVDQLGSSNVDAVNACTVGLDTAALLNAAR
jgi:hypothetical protein